VLVELAVGDAYGAGFEYADPGFVATHNSLEGYVQHPAHSGVRPGAYTHRRPAKVEEYGQGEPLVMTARVGRGTDALSREVTVLTLEDPTGQARRYALVRRDVRDTDDPANNLG
jgi:hypothetical protein